MTRFASRLRCTVSRFPVGTAGCLAAVCLLVFSLQLLLLRKDGDEARTRDHRGWPMRALKEGAVDGDIGGCVVAIERLLIAQAGWKGRSMSGLARLGSEADRKMATEACWREETADIKAHKTATIDDQSHCFAQKLNRSERVKSMRHLATIASELEQAGVEFYLDMGTALGAYRHFEMIPYDEDIDIRINSKQKPSAKTALARLRYSWPEMLFQDTEWENQHWKVHFMDTMDPVLERRVALDVFFYTINESSNRLEIREAPFAFPIGDIFPLVQRPFYNRWYFTPNSIGAMISGYFANTSLSDCVYYLHDLPFNQCQRPVVPCRELRDRYAFTETIQLPQGQMQYLIDYQGHLQRPVVTAVAFIAGANRF